MENCSRQCIRQTFFAVLIGISPVVICLLFIGLARLLIHCLELSYNRRQKPDDYRRRSSSFFHQAGRPTLSYTPVSLTELHRIIQGDRHNQQQNDSSFLTNILNRKEPPTVPTTNTLGNLVIRRNAINSTPFTALFAPLSTASYDVINEQSKRRSSMVTIKHESIETTTLATGLNPQQSNSILFHLNDFDECETNETDPLVTLPQGLTTTTTTTTTTVVLEEFLDFHSVHSIPYSMNLTEPLLDNND